MIDTRKTPESDSLRARRDQRQTAGLVAQYMHELSERHGRPASAGQPRRGRTTTLAVGTSRVRG
jgi:hypothetical protein